MSGRPPQALRQRDERGHSVVKDAIEKGFVGSGEHYWIRGIGDHKTAQTARRAVNTAAQHLGVSCSSRMREDVLQEADGTWSVRFRLFTKESARAVIAARAAGDPSKLAYNPWARKARRILDDAGNPM